MDTQVKIVTTLPDGVLSKSCFDSRQEQNTFASPHSPDLFMGPYSMVSGMFSSSVKWWKPVADYSFPPNTR